MGGIDVGKDGERDRGLAYRAYESGMWAWIFQRGTGVILVGYLFFHLVVLSAATSPGPPGMALNRVLAVFRNPLVIYLDLVLIAVILVHAANGIRLIILDLGYGFMRQKGLFRAAMVASGLVLLLAAWHLLA